MKIKAILTKEEHTALPKDMQALYVVDGDTFVLEGVDDTEYATKLGEFRTNNRKLMDERKALESAAAKFKGVDLEKYQKAMEALGKIDEQEDAELLKAGKMDEVVKKRVATLQSEHAQQLKILQDNLTTKSAAEEKYRKQLAGLLIETSVMKALPGSPRKSAVADIMSRAREVWQVDEEGKLKAEGVFNDKAQPVTMEEWGKKLLVDAPHLFEPSSGGGSGGGQKHNTTGGKYQVNGRDPVAVGKAAADIASGKATVVND